MAEISNETNDTIITGTAGNDTITNSGENVTINALGGDDIISNGGQHAIIDMGDGNDFINNLTKSVTIAGGDGNDTIWSWGDSVSVDGGAGDDTITNNKVYVTINGGDGDDTVYSTGSNVTINTGAGNDSINFGSASNVLIQYTAGDGNDLIDGFNETSTLSISGGGYYNETVENDIIVNVGSDKITLAGAASLESVNIDGTDNESIAKGIAISAFQRTSAGYPLLAAFAFHPNEYHGDEPTNYAEKENWSITSSDGLTLNAVHYTPQNSNDKWILVIHGYGQNHKHMYPFTTQFLNGGYNVLMIDQRAAGDSEGEWLTMGSAESADVALWTQEIARHNTDAKITLFGVSMGSATAMLAAARSDITNVTSLVEDCGYSDVMEVVNVINENLLHVDKQAIDLLDTVTASLTGHYLTEAKPIDSISAAKMPTLFITGSADSVISPAMLDELYDASGAEVKEKFIVEGATHGLAASVDAVGYSNTFLRFVAEADEEGWNTVNDASDISLRGTKYDDSIASNGSNVTIYAGAGNDTLLVGAGKTTMYGGDGDDVFIYGGTGRDVIADYATGDRISLGAAIIHSSLKGSDVAFYVDNGRLTVKDVKDTELTLINADGSELTTIIGDTATYDESFSGKAVLASGVAIADASARKSGIKLSANNLDNTIIGGRGSDKIYGGAGDDSISGNNGNDNLYGGAGSDTLWGGKGNDFLSGGTGADTFIYTAGNDIVSGFDGDDLLQITGDWSAFVDTSDKTIAFTVGEGSLTVKNFTATTFNINGDAYAVSGSELVKK